jgi:hypothetical protein
MTTWTTGQVMSALENEALRRATAADKSIWHSGERLELWRGDGVLGPKHLLDWILVTGCLVYSATICIKATNKERERQVSPLEMYSTNKSIQCPSCFDEYCMDRTSLVWMALLGEDWRKSALCRNRPFIIYWVGIGGLSFLTVMVGIGGLVKEKPLTAGFLASQG